MAEQFDVVIVGAGISGIGMAAHLARQCPGKSYAILDRRAQPGGTWDLFRYPGIRSDSDIHTFAYKFAPWRDDNTVVSGEQIRDYLARVIGEHDIGPHLRFGQHVRHANWDSAAALWRIEAEQADGSVREVLGKFVVMGTGYYDYDAPYDPQIPGLADFRGSVIHPQFWPEGFDHAGKNVVVIGSGATAVTLIPALAQTAAHVTMLQRTPTWYGVRPSVDKSANLLRRIMPENWAYAINRFRAQKLHDWLFKKARSSPEGFARVLTGQIKGELGEHWTERDFTPPYNPWEQRLCLVPDGDLFAAIREGRASVVTGTIKRVVAGGIELDDGTVIEADVIITATGLALATLGKISLSIDGAPVNLSDRYWYRNCLFSNVPNLAAIFGYLNAGWTLRVDLVADYLCRLINQMDAWRADAVMPELPEDHDLVEFQPVDMFTSGYLQRGKHIIPRSATTAPWRLQMFHFDDKREFAAVPVDDGWLKIVRRRARAAA